jgi:hypothetical protein
MAAAGRQQPSWIFQIFITFKPLDRPLQNLVVNFVATRAFTRNVQILKNPRWRPQGGGHLGFFKSL